MFVTRRNRFQLHTPRPDELARLLDRQRPLAHEFDPHARLLQNLAHRRVVGEFMGVDVAARREPAAELFVFVEEHTALPYDEGGGGEVPGGLAFVLSHARPIRASTRAGRMRRANTRAAAQSNRFLRSRR